MRLIGKTLIKEILYWMFYLLGMNFSLMKLASFAILVPNFYTVRAFSLGAPLPRAFWRSTIFASSYFKVSSTFTTIYSICCLLGPCSLAVENASLWYQPAECVRDFMLALILLVV